MSPTACCQHSSPRDPLRTEVRPGVHAPGALVSPQNRTQDQKRGSPGPTRSGPRPLSELTSPLTPHPAARPPAGPQPAHVLLAPYPGLRTPHLTPPPPARPTPCSMPGCAQYHPTLPPVPFCRRLHLLDFSSSQALAAPATRQIHLRCPFTPPPRPGALVLCCPSSPWEALSI